MSAARPRRVTLATLSLALFTGAMSSTAVAKPLHKHPDFVAQTFRQEMWSLTTRCAFTATRDTKVAGVPVAEGDVIGGACNTLGEALLPAVYARSIRHGAGGKVYWGKRVDTGKIDLIVEDPRKFGAIAVSTDYDMAWSPLISGTSDAERTAFFAGYEQEDGTFWVDIVGPDGEARGSIPNVTDVVDYRTAYLVAATYPFGKTHQVVSMEGELLTPLLPELTRRGNNWVFEVEGDLVMPVRPNGVVGRSNPHIQGYRSLGPHEGSWAYASVWELPDGTTAYGLVDADFGDMTAGVFESLTPTENNHGFAHIVGKRRSGGFSAYSLHSYYKPTEFAVADSAEALAVEVERFFQAQIERSEARQAAFDAEMAERRRRQQEAEEAWRKAQQEAAANRPTVQWRSGRSCQQSYEQRDQLTLDEAHDAMKNCYYTLSYQEWLEVDRVYMALQRPPPVKYTPVAPTSYRNFGGQDQDAISRQRFSSDLDRYMRGESSYDPTDTDW